jgi:hypothetical protein
MDYNPLIEQAKNKNKWTDYKLNKALGYKSVSMIYRVKRGKAGLSAEKLMLLMKLAGKTLAVAVIATTALLPQKSEASVSGQVYEKTGLFIHYTK